MSENRTRESVLIVAGASSFAIAIVHLAIMLIGPPAYRWFGAPALAVEVERGSMVPAVLCIIVAALLSVWGVYAFAGAGRVSALPLLRTALFVIGTIYVLRGFLGIPQLVWMMSGNDAVPFRYVLFSFVSGITGVLYLTGLVAIVRGGAMHSPRSMPA
jgi:hypothetical protein